MRIPILHFQFNYQTIIPLSISSTGIRIRTDLDIIDNLNVLYISTNNVKKGGIEVHTIHRPSYSNLPPIHLLDVYVRE
jgi:hypothetical protein